MAKPVPQEDLDALISASRIPSKHADRLREANGGSAGPPVQSSAKQPKIPAV